MHMLTSPQGIKIILRDFYSLYVLSVQLQYPDLSDGGINIVFEQERVIELSSEESEDKG
jgi:hypothetical protein